MNLLLKVAGGLGQRGSGRVIMDHGEGYNEQHDAQNGLHGLLPAIAHNAGFGRGSEHPCLLDMGFGHECRWSLAKRSKSFYFSRVRNISPVRRRAWSVYLGTSRKALLQY